MTNTWISILIAVFMSFSLMDWGSVTVEELERHGPGLIVNGHGDEGHQILVWIE